MIVNWRMLHDERTRIYLNRRQAQQKSDPEIRRCLKRYTARSLYRLMESTPGLDGLDGLKSVRHRPSTSARVDPAPRQSFSRSVKPT